MPITITAHFETVKEAVEFMNGRADAQPEAETAAPKPRGRKAVDRTVSDELRAAQTAAPTPQVAHPEAAKSAPAAAASTPAPEAPKPVEAAQKQPNQPVQAIQQAQAAAVHPATPEGVRTALRDVFNTKGATLATSLLKGFGAARISDVQPAQHAAFVAAAANPEAFVKAYEEKVAAEKAAAAAAGKAA